MIPKALRKFDINIKSLSDNKHDFSFIFLKDLFLFYDKSIDLKNIKGKCDLTINKRDNMMEMSFKIKGRVDLICDRSLKTFNYNVIKEENIIVKFGKLNEEINEEIISIKYNTAIFNISKYIYDFFLLSIPLKRLHPSLENEDIIDTFVFSTKEVKSKKMDLRLALLKKIKR